MKHNTRAVVGELQSYIQQARNSIVQLTQFPEKQLQQRPLNGGWNALECLEHLNRYAAYYVPTLEKTLTHAVGKAGETYNSGWLGEYFAKTMRAENAKPGKMKSPKAQNPAGASLNPSEVLRTFEKNLERTEAILKQSLSASWNRTRIPTSLSPLLRLNLGDTLRFYVYHVDRHMQQALRAAQSTS